MKHYLLKSLAPAFLIGFAFAGDALAQRSGFSSASAHGAPEIHPGLAAAGIVLLIGGTLVLTGRRRAKTA